MKWINNENAIYVQFFICNVNSTRSRLANPSLVYLTLSTQKLPSKNAAVVGNISDITVDAYWPKGYSRMSPTKCCRRRQYFQWHLLWNGPWVSPYTELCLERYSASPCLTLSSNRIMEDAIPMRPWASGAEQPEVPFLGCQLNYDKTSTKQSFDWNILCILVPGLQQGEYIMIPNTNDDDLDVLYSAIAWKLHLKGT